MSKTREFFESTLPAKMVEDPEELEDIAAVIQFDIEGAGSWTVDLNELRISEEPIEEPDCVITVAEELWEQVLDVPDKATQFFMMGELRATNLGLAIQLQKLLA